ncbi:MAG: hypothetical protein M0D55_19855 [Elusimicrobiota bacterium]|nr:MAG: hypothetical protein M0D55_19855 [Elusimicrobiota bacterium]
MCLPVHSPDLFWHLSAGRWMAAHRAIPSADPFSFTRLGEPWLDFEWLLQLFWYGVHSLGGLRALWALKGLSLAAVWLPVDGLLRDKGAGAASRAAALALWACAILPMADLRADLASAALLAVLLRRLEAGRASFLFGFGVFALWSNLHAGFPAGLALYAAYALGQRLGGRRIEGLGAEACGALLGCLLNPYGLGLAAVFAAHGRDSVGTLVLEWGPIDWGFRYHRPLIAALFAGAVAARAARRSSPALAAAAAVLAVATAVSSRFAVYFAPVAAAAFGAAFPGLGLAAGARLLGAASLLLVASAHGAEWGRAFSDVFVERAAADFVVAERETFGRLRVFNTYEWGGYLGWRLGPEGKVFGDGRYLFHGQLAEIRKALTSPEEMSAFVSRHRLDALLIRRYPERVRGTMLFPDGASVEVTRPWHASYLPRSRWALVYADRDALVFVDRAKVPAEWLAAREISDRPGDEEARDAAAAHGGDRNHPAPKQTRR